MSTFENGSDIWFASSWLTNVLYLIFECEISSWVNFSNVLVEPKNSHIIGKQLKRSVMLYVFLPWFKGLFMDVGRRNYITTTITSPSSRNYYLWLTTKQLSLSGMSRYNMIVPKISCGIWSVEDIFFFFLVWNTYIYEVQ
jgi:hypothetical protein